LLFDIKHYVEVFAISFGLIVARREFSNDGTSLEQEKCIEESFAMSQATETNVNSLLLEDSVVRLLWSINESLRNKAKPIAQR